MLPGLKLAQLRTLAICSLAAMVGYCAPVIASTRILVFSPSALNFGGVIVGNTSASEILTLANVSKTSVVLNSVVTTAGFAQTNNCPVSPAALAPGASCAITITFSPTVPGPESGNVTVVSDSLPAPIVANLKGTGIVLRSIAISPGNITMKVGQTVSLAAIGTYSDRSTRNITASVTWTSSNPAMATVSNIPPTQGQVLAIGTGAVSLKASAASSPAGLIVTGVASSPILGPDPRFAYALNAGDDTLSLYTENSTTGQLRQNGYVVTGPINSEPVALALDPFGRFAYVVNQGNNTVSAFTINSTTGLLTSVAGDPRPTGDTPSNATVDSLGRFLYVTNTDSDDISAYAINQTTGALTPVPGSPFTTVTIPGALATPPNGGVLYVITNGTVISFTIHGNTGALTPLGSPVSAGVSPRNIAIDPLGRFAFVPDHDSNNLLAFTINATTGALSPVSGSPFATGLQPNEVAVDPSGSFAYAANSGDSTISAFTINPTTGALSSIGSAVLDHGFNPSSLAVDENGKFLYVADSTNNQVDAFQINGSTGGINSTYVTGSRNEPASIGLASGIKVLEYTPSYLYAVDAWANEVNVYSISSTDGSLTPTTDQPFATAITTPVAMAVDPQRRFAYVAGVDQNEVAGYSINFLNGDLTLIGTFASGDFSEFNYGIHNYDYLHGDGKVDPSGKFLYFASGNTITAYTINPVSGSLTQISGSPFPIPSQPDDSAGVGITIDPTGRFLYVADAGSEHLVIGFEINPSTGVLAPLFGSPFALPLGDCLGPWDVEADPSGRFLYAIDCDGVFGFTIDFLSGELTEISGSPFSGSIPIYSYATIDPDGKFLIQPGASGGAAEIAVLSIDAVTGILTPVTGSIFSSGDAPTFPAVDPSGTFLYVGSAPYMPTTTPNPNLVDIFSVDSLTGFISPTGNTPVSTGNNPLWIVVTGMIQ